MAEMRSRNKRRWGIIFAPRIGALRPMTRWKEMREYLHEKGVEYDFVLSDGDGAAERQAKEFADNGYDTVVVIGGDGALQDALNGIFASANAKDVTLGLIPNGIANDFAAYWGLTYRDYRMAIDCIIARRVRKVDVGCCAYNVDGNVNRRYFLNVLNVGMSANVVGIANKNTHFARFIYRARALVYLLFSRSNFRMKFSLNSQVVDKKFMMLCVGNSLGYGMTPSAVPYNGWLDVSAIRMSPLLGMVEGLLMLFRRRILNYKHIEPFRTTEIRIDSVGGARLGIDGRPFEPTFPLTVTVEPEKLNFIIPIKTNRKL